MPKTTGWDLTVARVRADLTKTEVACELGTTRQTLWAWERSAFVDPDKAAAFLRAVEKLGIANETPTEDAA